MGVVFTNGGDVLELPTVVGVKARLALPTVRSAMGIPSGANATINGEPISNDYTFKEGDSVVFYKPSGEKGKE